jgi:hypothetical protein
MKIQLGLFSAILFSILILAEFTSSGQQKHTGIKAYLIIKNQSSIIKNDSLFEAGLRTRLSRELKKKNIILVPNEEMETAEKMHLYIKVDISDSLRISYWKSMAPQSNGTISVPAKNKVYKYNDEADIAIKIIAFAQKYL